MVMSQLLNMFGCTCHPAVGLFSSCLAPRLWLVTAETAGVKLQAVGGLQRYKADVAVWASPAVTGLDIALDLPTSVVGVMPHTL